MKNPIKKIVDFLWQQFVDWMFDRTLNRSEGRFYGFLNIFFAVILGCRVFFVETYMQKIVCILGACILTILGMVSFQAAEKF